MFGSENDEIFEFSHADFNKDLGKHGVNMSGSMLINVTQLQKMCELGAPISTASISDETYSDFRNNTEIEPEKLAFYKMSDSLVTEQAPLLFLAWPDAEKGHDTQALAMGCERLVVAWGKGQREFPAWVVPRGIWMNFIVGFALHGKAGSTSP